MSAIKIQTAFLYTVKGVALMKLSDGSGSALDIQLDAGNYNEKDLIGKTLNTIDSEFNL
ncbi:hypothetical protein QA584_22080 [Anaerocolumna sp. AGMB13025]|uniref:hypothetical protein n=1 Tax=Anaerocolumna sp. AGMB13025 TaxID=3039116 RepID=UPI00241DA3ED|nr:hypothetical protein [Anaerocolumna sp. AGMB13025]WFR56279.1 hypothetical protein QA584_22080 [Anaerocolumna sp. AGMB13025]